MYSLYIHIPFCKKKCLYCDFASTAHQELLPAYIAALSQEMKKYAREPISTLFIGGGTPSLLSIEQWGNLFAQVRRSFSCSSLAEITVEANPESLTAEKLRALKILGVNRLSIGVQSFIEEELGFLGRVHTVTEAKNAITTARHIGFTNINIDLIYGLPHQTSLLWQKTLNTALSFAPEHISLYPLTVEDGTPFAKSGVVVDDEEQAALYEWSTDFLCLHGYNHYEISNWAKEGSMCRHNLTYWNNKEYIGIGVAAASYQNAVRKKNCGDVAEYIRLIEVGASPIEEYEAIDEATKLSEEIILKLRCSRGVEVTDAIEKKYSGAIQKMQQLQLLERHERHIRLTRKGLLLSNQVMKEFV